MAHGFCGSVGSAALAPGTGVLADGNTVVEQGVVALVADLGEVGVEGVGHVGGQAEGVGEAVGKLHALGIAQAAHEVLEELALHAGNAHGADLFLVGQDAHGSLGGILNGKQGVQLCVSAYPVVVAVGAQQAAVQTHLPAAAGGDNGQFGRQKVGLDQAVLLVEQLHDVQLHQVGAFAFQRLGAQQHVQLLAFDALGQGLLHLIGGQVNQKVGDHQYGIVVIFTDGDGNDAAVLAVHHTVQSQGDGGPLVLLDAAVVVGLEVGDFAVLVQGIGLNVHPGRVHMGGADVDALGKRLGANHCQSDGFIPVVIVDLVTGLDIHAGDKGAVAPLFCFPHSPGGSFPLGLAGIDKGHVAFAVGFHFFTLLGSQLTQAVLGLHQQRFPEFFSRHKSISPLGMISSPIIPSCCKKARHLSRN